MNKTYDVSERFHSNNGIYDAFYAEVVAPAYRMRKAGESVTAGLAKFRKILIGATAKRLAKVSGVALSLLGIVGAAGGIQSGKLSLLGGLTVTAILLGVEYLCLKSIGKSQKQN